MFIRSALTILLALLFTSKANSFWADSLRLKIKEASGIRKVKLTNYLASKYTFVYPDTALMYARQSEHLLEGVNNDTARADVNALIGECLMYLAKYDSAAIYYLKAIELAEKLNYRKKMASFNNGLGMLFFQIGDNQKAVDYMQKAAVIKFEDKDFLSYAMVNTNIAGAMQRLGKYKEALAILRDSELRIKQYNNVTMLANIYNMIGAIYQMELKIDSAQSYYEKTLSMLTDEKDMAYKFTAYANLGEILIVKGRLADAETNLLHALNLSGKLSRHAERSAIYNSLSGLYEQKNEPVKALEYKKKYIELKDSIFNKEKEGLIRDIEGKYEAGQKDLQIKSQELELQKEKTNKFQLALFSILAIVLLIFILIYIWFNRRLESKLRETKERFFTNVMHEIRTPLSMIRGPLNLLKGKLNDEERLYHIDLADRNATRLTELMDQMLDISKFNNLSYVLKNSVGDIELFVDEIVSDHERMAGEKEIVFKKHITHFNSLLYFDKDALHKIISNLLSNAIKYTKPGGQISFSLIEQQSTDHSTIAIEVKDNGIGIPRKEQKKLFTRFYRSEKVVDHTKGIGIGLSLVKDLVDAHQGSITFESEEGKGTTFNVSLKFKRENAIETGKMNPGAGNKGVVLLVEDNADMIQFVGSLLHKEGFQVTKASNGKMALEILKELAPDLIVSDVMMDEMDGLTFIKKVKATEGLDHIPVIALSAKSSERSRTEIMNAGAQLYLTKPFLPQELLAAVQNQLSLIAKLRAETKEKIETPELKAEQKFSSKEPYIQKLFDLIFKHYERSDLSVEYLADLMATNRSHFQRKVKSLTGYSPSDLIKYVRLEKAKEFLQDKKGNVTEVAYMCGFSTQSYFTRCFTEHFNRPPSEFI